ncbi:MAG: hypothetical protein KIT10_06025 [Flavobacteriales bacterium]|nr:hypothetical protein [Flavobacteriales bacterium]
MRTLFKHLPATFLAALIYIIIMLFALAASAQPIIVHGELLLPVEVISRPSIELIAPDGTVTPMKVRTGDRFRVSLDQKGTHLLCFHKPGCRTKVVLVDTRHSPARAVRFDVMLEPAEGLAPGTDAQYAGGIRFHASNGRMLLDRLHENAAPLTEVIEAKMR